MGFQDNWIPGKTRAGQGSIIKKYQILKEIKPCKINVRVEKNVDIIKMKDLKMEQVTLP